MWPPRPSPDRTIPICYMKSSDDSVLFLYVSIYESCNTDVSMEVVILNEIGNDKEEHSGNDNSNDELLKFHEK